MRIFKDTQGRSWSVTIDIGTAKRVRDVTGCDLLDSTGAVLDALSADTIQLVDVLWVIVMPQARQIGISDEQFGASLNGDVIEQATEALVQEMLDFCPTRKANLLRGMMKKEQQKIEAALTQLEKELAETSGP